MHLFLFFSLFGVAIPSSITRSTFPLKDRDPRFFFSINSPQECSPMFYPLPSGVTGVCTQYFSCISSGGIIGGSCSFGLKSCCLFETTTPPPPPPPPEVQDFIGPVPPPPSVSHTVKRINDFYCQLYVEFFVFELASPNPDGVCDADNFFVTPATNGVPELCGINSGHHLYLNFDSTNSINLNFKITDNSARWFIRTTQIQCSQAAPSGCLQYHQSLKGTFKSFNYPETELFPYFAVSQLANQDYTICLGDVRVECFGEITPTPASHNFSFTVSDDVHAYNISEIGSEALVKAGSIECQTDYVKLPEFSAFPSGNATRIESVFCGLAFPEEVTILSPVPVPWQIKVKTDADELSDGGNAGFSLDYTMMC